MPKILAYERGDPKGRTAFEGGGGPDAITVWFSVEAEYREEFYLALRAWLAERFPPLEEEG